MVKCPWCNEWEGPPAKYSDHLKYCKKYPPHYEVIKEQARIHPMQGYGPEKIIIEILHEPSGRREGIRIEGEVLERLRKGAPLVYTRSLIPFELYEITIKFRERSLVP